MNELFNTILTNTSAELTVSSAAVTMLAALLFGGAVAYTYRRTQEGEAYQRSLAVTLFMLPMILSVIILFVGSNVARAFSLAGTLSIIRFRSNPGDAKDIGFIFFAIAAGLACGVGLFAYGTLFVAVLCIVLLITERAGMFMPRSVMKNLRITVPEDLNYSAAFNEILDRYTKKYTLAKIRTVDLGSLFELSYNLTLAEDADEKQLIDELRTRNGNLTVILSEMPRN